MNKKHANWLFLSFNIISTLLIVLLSFLQQAGIYQLSMQENMIMSGAIFWLPSLLFLFFTKTNPFKFLRLKKIKIATIGKVILFTIVAFPITSFLNSLTMLFTENAILEISDEILQLPFLLIFFFMAVYGPLSEELAFRGVIFHGYLQSGSRLKAILLSSLLFGMAHMNLNQFVYAFVLGILMALLVEATGSIVSAFVFHILFNSFSVINLFISKETLLDATAMEASQEIFANSEMMFMVISVLLVIALVCLLLAGCILVWIAKGENRTEALKSLKIDFKENKSSLITIPLIIGLIIGVVYMGLNLFLI